MVYSPVIVPKVAEGWVSRQTNLGMSTYDLNELYSPDTDLWKSTVLDLASPKYPPQKAANPTQYIFDKSRYNNHGTLIGATWVQLPSGLWVNDLDGTDDYIEIPDAASLDITGKITIKLWVNPTDVAADHALIDKAVGDNTKRNYYVMISITTGALFFNFKDASNVWFSSQSTVAVPTGKYSQVGVTFDEATDELKFYLNGALGETMTSTGAMTANTGSLWVGVNKYTAAADYMKGKLGLVLIGNGIWNAGDFLKSYNQERHLFNV